MDFHLELDRLQDALAIIGIGALGGMMISATIGSSVLAISGAIPVTAFWPTWAVWWTGDAMGVLLVAPFLLSFVARRSSPALGWQSGLELVGLLVITTLVTYLLFQNQLDLEYLVLPIIMLAAWRFGLRGASPAALIASGIAIWSAIRGIGPFAGETLLGKMVTLQVFNVSIALGSFLLASFAETRRRKEEIASLYESAQLASQEKTRFLHMAAHELRTPISVVAGYLSMLSDGTFGTVPQAWRKPLDILMGKAGELNHIVADLLEASRIEANLLPSHPSDKDLRSIVHAARERAWPRAQLLGAEIATVLPDDPVCVWADGEQLGRILDNLINNGLSYSVEEPHLLITVTGEGDRAVVRVADNGVGIPESERERVFERFHRSNEPAFRNIAGTGLGLFISRQLAEGHGGSLVIEGSAAGGGTVFALTLPRAVTPSIEVGAEGDALEPSRIDGATGALTGARVS